MAHEKGRSSGRYDSRLYNKKDGCLRLCNMTKMRHLEMRTELDSDKHWEVG